MPSINDEDKDLLLSMYLDKELDAATTAAVAERIRTDRHWADEYKRLQKAERESGIVAARFHEDNEFTQKVMKGIKYQPVMKPATGKLPTAKVSRRFSRRHSVNRHTGWLVRIASIAALIVIGIYFVQNPPGAEPQVANNAPARNTDPNMVVVTEQLQTIAWPDGTRIWARKGSEIVRLSSRSMRLIKGEVLVHVAPNTEPFRVFGPDGSQAEAHGTRFDVQQKTEGFRVRVAEGYVRVESVGGAKTVDAFGGTEVSNDMTARSFDPRDMAEAWFQPSIASIPPSNKAQAAKKASQIAEAIVPPWPQVGGSAGHSNMTTVRAPQTLVGKKTLFFPYPQEENTDAPTIGAVISADGRAYVVRRHGEEKNETKLMELTLSGPQRGSWRDIATIRGVTVGTPVITPRGLLAIGTSEGALQMFSQNGGRVCSHQESGPIYALCSAPSGLLLLSTSQGLVALNDYDGSVRWRYSGIGDIKYSATVLPAGLICVAGHGGRLAFIDMEGKEVSNYQWNEGVAEAPVVDALSDGDQVLVLSPSGRVALLNAKKGVQGEKAFKKAIRCSPASNGLIGVGSEVIHLEKNTKARSAITDEIVSLAVDGNESCFAGFPTGILRLQKAADGSYKDNEFVTLAEGKVTRHGLAIFPGALVVTTTRGIQLFE